MVAQQAVWHHHQVHRAAGAVSALVTYDSRPGHPPDLRNLRLVVRRAGAVVIDRVLHEAQTGTPAVSVRDVWGDAEPEVVLRITSCGNRCGYLVVIVIPAKRHLIWRWFGHDGVSVQKNDIVSGDERFFCAFDSCANSTEPIQVFSIDASGSRLVDVTRLHLSLVRADAANLRSGGGLHLLGIRAAYCGAEYLLGIHAYCDAHLPARVRKQMAAWGYR